MGAGRRRDLKGLRDLVVQRCHAVWTERDYRYMVGDQPKYLRRGSLYENIPCQAKFTTLFNLSQNRIELIQEILLLGVPIERS